uniref:Chemokine interleukin-8-like domain-containing protein n=1 Tax=Oryzias melastigma TaxID=30732 RepID=A0A3B3CI89_ORYME
MSLRTIAANAGLKNLEMFLVDLKKYINCMLLLIVIYRAILKCRCLRTSQRVDESLIRTVEELPPRPYCAKDEIIVTLKDNKKVCLDPTHKFTKMNKGSYCDKTEINIQLK